jgi:hypothetical protein
MVDIADLETRRIDHARRSAHANRTAWRHPQRQPHPTGLGIRVRLARVLRALAARLDPPARHAPNVTPLAL